jgi:hypothetical protein
MRSHSEDLHPDIVRAIRQGRRDIPLSLSWAPWAPGAFAILGLPDTLNPLAAAMQPRIIAAMLAAGDRWISYARNRSFYTGLHRYYIETYTYAATVPAVDQLDQQDWIEHRKILPGNLRVQSSFRAKQKLLDMLASVRIVYQPREIIILRDADGNLVDYRDNRLTRRMRKNLMTINEALQGQTIELDGRIIREGDRLPTFETEKGNLADIGRMQTCYCRIFHRSDWDCGGRFYNGWQNIPKHHRARITINGETTAEADYTALHVTLLYQQAEKPMPPGDPYEVGTFPRKWAKQATLIAINAVTENKAVGAVADWLREEGAENVFKTAAELVKTVKSKHREIDHAFASDAGVRLMRIDSDMTEAVMKQTIQETGIVPLASHDGFRVPTKHAGRVVEVMDSVIGVPGSCRIKPAPQAQP